MKLTREEAKKLKKSIVSELIYPPKADKAVAFALADPLAPFCLTDIAGWQNGSVGPVSVSATGQRITRPTAYRGNIEPVPPWSLPRSVWVTSPSGGA
ncbi:oxidoreductase [Salmonella bongori]|nr:oxidoreductase [Salmonella bongori]